MRESGMGREREREGERGEERDMYAIGVIVFHSLLYAHVYV